MPGRHAAARTGLGRARVRLPGAEGAMAWGWEGRAAGRRGASQRAQGDDNDLRAKRAEAWAAQSVIIGPIGEHRPRSLSRAWGGGGGGAWRLRCRAAQNPSIVGGPASSTWWPKGRGGGGGGGGDGESRDIGRGLTGDSRHCPALNLHGEHSRCAIACTWLPGWVIRGELAALLVYVCAKRLRYWLFFFFLFASLCRVGAVALAHPAARISSHRCAVTPCKPTWSWPSTLRCRC